jgi:chromate transporter
LIAFAPSFAFVLALGPRFESFRSDRRARAFLAGAGPAAIGAILGAAGTLAGALQHGWQFAVLGLAVVVLVVVQRAIVPTLLAAAGVGVILALAGVAV